MRLLLGIVPETARWSCRPVTTVIEAPVGKVGTDILAPFKVLRNAFLSFADTH